MKELKHTPGPWIVHGNPETLKYNISGNVNHENESYFVANIITHRPLEKIEANARLIAAAPEMLDYLIMYINSAIINWENNCEYEFDFDNWKEISEAECIKANKEVVDIIEKATGLKIKEILK